MKNANKALSVLIALVMLFSTFTIGVTAGAPDLDASATQKVSIAYEAVDADGASVTTVKEGDIVTVNVYSNAKNVADTMTGFNISIWFDSNVYTYVEGSIKWLGVTSWIDDANSSIDICKAGNTHFNNCTNKLTEAEKAAHPTWDAMAYVVGIANGSVDYNVHDNANTPMFSIQLKVNAGVAEGADAVIGCPASAHYNAAVRTYCAVKTPSTTTRVKNGDVLTPTDCAITVASAVSGPVVAKAGAQVKFTPDTTTANKVADKFMFRVKSVIKADDWNKYFANTTVDGATTNTLTAVGLVAFPATEEFNADKANEAIAAIGDKDYAGAYKAASTNHIQKAEGDNTDAYFGAIINISHENCASDIKYIGFAQYKDGNGDPQIIFYNAAETALVTGDAYDTLVNRYKTDYASMFPA